MAAVWPWLSPSGCGFSAFLVRVGQTLMAAEWPGRVTKLQTETRKMPCTHDRSRVARLCPHSLAQCLDRKPFHTPVLSLLCSHYTGLEIDSQSRLEVARSGTG